MGRGLPSAWFRTAVLRLVLASLIASGFASAAAAAPPELTSPCLSVHTESPSPEALFANDQATGCLASASDGKGRFTVALFRNLDLGENGAPYEFRHTFYQVGDETLYVQYADGRVVQSPTSAKAARKMLATPELAFALPQSDAPIAAIALVARDLQNPSGVALAPRIVGAKAGAAQDDLVKSINVAMGGALLLLLFVFGALLAMLRYRFIAWRCIGLVAVIAFGLVWTGGIFLLTPGMSFATQHSLLFFSAALYIFAGLLFQVEYLGQENLPRRVRRAASAMATALLAIATSRWFLPESTHSWVDSVFYLLLAATLVAMVATTALAWRNGSIAVRLFFLAWLPPVALAVYRIAWNLGWTDTGLAELVTPPLLMCMETLLSLVAIFARIGELRAEHDKSAVRETLLRELADTDPLTGLLNRRAFVARILSDDVPKQLIILDVDHFKAVNDCFGHSVGDDVLLHLAMLLNGNCPDDAIIGRIGGEEFAVATRADRTPGLAETLRRTVEDSDFPHGLHQTVSIGVALGSLTDEAGWQEVYSQADSALYSAKHRGRNRVCLAPVQAQAA